MSNEIEKLYSTVEAAALLKCGADTLRLKINRGEINARRIGKRRYYLSADDINAYLSGGLNVNPKK